MSFLQLSEFKHHPFQEEDSKLCGASRQLAQITQNQAAAGSFGHVSDGFETCAGEGCLRDEDLMQLRNRSPQVKFEAQLQQSS
jgi:hypothetical protein